MSSYLSTPNSYERVYLSFDPMHRLMRERNITDLELARKAGVKVDVIRNIDRYQDTVTLSMVRSICEALDCELEEIIIRIQNDSPKIRSTRAGKPVRKR